MDAKDIIIVTGQSGVKVRRCLQILNEKSNIDRDIVSVEAEIEHISKIPFDEFLALPQYLQHEYWIKAFDKICDRCTKKKFSPPLILTFHAVYYHQQKRELFPPVDFEVLSKLKNRVRMVIVLIDDIYDVYRRLMDKNQMYEGILDPAKTEQLDAILSSIFNIISLLNWREMEISLSRSIANLLKARPFIVSTKHPHFLINRLMETPLPKLKIYYLSHPITSIREKSKDVLHSFVGKLELLIDRILSYPDVVLFFPTSIDELIIRREEVNGKKYFYYPEFMQRWAHPYEDKVLSPSLPEAVKDVNALNPLNYNMSTEGNESLRNAVSHLLSLLWKYLYLKQIISRDYSLVEQSKSGVIACRPYLEGHRAGGVIKELSHNFRLMKNQGGRNCYIMSCAEDWDKWVVRRAFTLLDNYLISPPPDLDAHKEQWIKEGRTMAAESASALRQQLGETVLPDGYDFEVMKQQDEWDGDDFGKRSIRREEAFKRIHEEMQVDEISYHLEDDTIVKGTVYKRFLQNQFWNDVPVFLDEHIPGKNEVKKCL